MVYTFKSFTAQLCLATILIFSLLFQSCSEPADKFFDTAVLNTNMINDFATPRLAKHISDNTIEFADIPSSKTKGDEAVNDVKNKILYLEKSLKDIKGLSDSDKLRKAIKEESVALYVFVIPVYQKEYMAYAKLCDAKASKEEREQLAKSIEQKYYADFELKFSALLTKGKAFAEQHNIPVNWN
ncbi:hypothetical protein [Pedobacter xixiisoli]|uniref:Lipoprotein n=1 Tax=Pedobacter xixiisoli TaxID=1476464 RepID=A0A285ZXD6_9SPHI|nr:hypothetical protein [Pedobacter xixiisoli]SOD14322.1 hypothetical protein SAMN06297358_1516 [Pedobacter xixiisoli]